MFYKEENWNAKSKDISDAIFNILRQLNPYGIAIGLLTWVHIIKN